MPLTGEEHVEQARLWLEAGGSTEEVEGGGILLCAEVDQTQVIQHLPLQGGKVRRSLQTADSLGSSTQSLTQADISQSTSKDK